MIETPSVCSVRNLEQWIQHSLSQKFAYFDYGEVENISRYGVGEAPSYDLSVVKTPMIILYGGKDKLVDFSRLISALPNVIHSQEVAPHFHMDSLCGADAHIVVNPLVMKLIERL